MSGSKNRRNVVPIVFLTIIIALFLTAIYLILTIPKQYEDYTVSYSKEVKAEIIETISSSSLEEDIIKLKNEYSFDTMIFDNGVLVYTSNDLIYDVEYADDLFQNGYIYKGSIVDGDYLVWTIVYEADLSEFINTTLMKNLSLLLIQTILMITLLIILLRKTLKPLEKLSQIIRVLKDDSNSIESNEKLDEISEELVKVTNELKLKLYYSQKDEKEYLRRFLKQEDLLREQKNHLANVVHNVKGTFSAINFSAQCIANVKALDENEKLALTSIETSSVAALDYVTSSLNTVIDNKYDVYVEKSVVNVKDFVEEYFKFNNMLLLEKNLNVEITGSAEDVEVNVLKFDQIIDNILSNMIKYSRNSSTLQIEFNNFQSTFINEVSDETSKYSNSFGLKAIKELTSNIGIKHKFEIKNNLAVSILNFEDNKND